jgi:hypothetical protein
MSLFRDLLRDTNNFLSVMDEATRLEAEHYKKLGWTKEHGKWTPPDGLGDYFDGPGSHVSLGSFLEPAAKNLGIDITDWGSTVDRVKAWLAKVGR